VERLELRWRMERCTALAVEEAARTPLNRRSTLRVPVSPDLSDDDD